MFPFCLPRMSGLMQKNSSFVSIDRTRERELEEREKEREREKKTERKRQRERETQRDTERSWKVWAVFWQLL